MNLSQAALNKLWQQQSKPTQMHASKDLTGKIVDQGTGALSFDNFSRTLSADYSSSRILDSECPIWRQPTKSYTFVGVIFSTASMQHYIKKIKIFLGLEKMFDDQQLCLTYCYIMSQFHSVFYSVENVSGFDWIPNCILHDAWWSISRSKHFSSSQCRLQSAVSEANSYGTLFRIILFVSALKFPFCRMNSTSAIEMHSGCAVSQVDLRVLLSLHSEMQVAMFASFFTSLSFHR